MKLSDPACRLIWISTFGCRYPQRPTTAMRVRRNLAHCPILVSSSPLLLASASLRRTSTDYTLHARDISLKETTLILGFHFISPAEENQRKKMLALFKNGVVNPPKELHSQASSQASVRPKTHEEALKDFLDMNPNNNAFSLGFHDKAILAYAPPQPSAMSHHRLFCAMDDMYCFFLGRLSNLCNLNKRYGLSKGANEAMFVIEAYRTLRDRSPLPAYQVLKDLEGSFGFLIYDHKSGTVFSALGADNTVHLYWGIAADGSVMFSDNMSLIKASCRKSFAPFPAGCMYHSEGGLTSFEHPMNKMKAMPRVDSEGAMCGSCFAVDTYSKVNDMPRVGSASNWATWG